MELLISTSPGLWHLVEEVLNPMQVCCAGSAAAGGAAAIATATALAASITAEYLNPIRTMHTPNVISR